MNPYVRPPPGVSDNYYDISINKNRSFNGLSGKNQGIYGAKRVASLTSLFGAGEPKRPGDYYIQKLSKSSANLQSGANSAARPGSGESVVSLQSAASDETNSVHSSQFDVSDSRNSSSTSNSIVSLTGSPSNAGHTHSSKAASLASAGSIKAERIEEGENETELGNDTESDTEKINSSLSTITLQNSYADSKSSLTYTSPFHSRSRPTLKASSTSNVSRARPPLRASAKSQPALARSKTKYYSSKEKKERQQLRKKLYDDNDDDDILDNDMDLVFNVPVIRNYGDLYVPKKPKVLSRNELTDQHKTYHINTLTNIKPCPLPGKLKTKTASSLSVNSYEGNNSDADKHLSFDNEGEITQNLSRYYEDRSESYSKLVKLSREQNMMYKLPSYVKSQSSIDDINLISLEKLDILDQTRPINLPPKSSQDKVKHNREVRKVISNFELNSKSITDSRKRISESMIANYQSWVKLMTLSNDPNFDRKIHQDRTNLRKLAWGSLCPESLRFQLFKGILSSPNEWNKYKEAYRTSTQKHMKLSDSIKVNKNIEFERLYNSLLERPFYDALIKSFEETENFDWKSFKNNFRALFNTKSFSETGLLKHDIIFIIPIFLIMFQADHTIEDIYIITELFNAKILNAGFVKQLNNSFNAWSSSANLSSTSIPKQLRSFGDLKEFDGLNFNIFFDILLQLNDKLPLSLSAPSTPVSNSCFQFPMAATESSGSNGEETSNRQTQMFESQTMPSLSIISMFLQLLVMYHTSEKNKEKYNLKVFESFLMTLFTYYHINWNDYNELIKGNKSIKVNNHSDGFYNFDSFMEKWRPVFSSS
ncbi:Piso0_004231 [Millerozyma farinosa CBS 7064]|uniref:Piso0_004231 protein n=1 Tax=Pichia sorbitophila (strain ATCC MYA-4447 / BCRC 22081 / CBS 7064 / NBRC 10061 / NRRL Y-12695) TaxID=559304 RepID=G8YAY3_PICSO|nr:Piso0_004231 [Millerozyma farinosa CBS 7064]CCE84678.1 Piso0_004231 [Millerozyma farinosa CBS 7064]